MGHDQIIPIEYGHFDYTNNKNDLNISQISKRESGHKSLDLDILSFFLHNLSHAFFSQTQTENSQIPYYIRYGVYRKRLHDCIISPYFDLVITGFVGANVLTMAVEYYDMPESLNSAQETLNVVFTFIFLIEAILRLVALGPKRYFLDRWNRLDMFIVVISILSILLNRFVDLKAMPIDPTLIRVIRVIRIARVLKLLKTARGIRSLLATVGESLPQVGNLALLFGLIFFIFSTLGVELFGRLSKEQRRALIAVCLFVNSGLTV